jgi:uncharacterized protein (TIGR00369 family)
MTKSSTKPRQPATRRTGPAAGAKSNGRHQLVESVRTFGAPCAKLVGFEVLEIEGGRAVGSMQTGPQHYNPMGTVHGGIICDLADAAMGMAFASTLNRGETFTTLEFKINFLRPVWESMLRAEAHVTNRGRTVGLVECTVRDERKRLVTKAVSICLILRGKHAVGR